VDVQVLRGSRLHRVRRRPLEPDDLLPALMEMLDLLRARTVGSASCTVSTGGGTSSTPSERRKNSIS
jgi:hypothetical protein